ncbi:MAG: NusG domain II-containing protein [Firmicutes bacterium]|nr:NusG domain II-containing protein [Bacillota bacterium]
MRNLIRQLKKADIILNVVILIAALGLWAFSIRGILQQTDRRAIAQYKNQEIENIDLTQENGIYTFSFDNNIVEYEIENGKIRLLKMEKELCPNAICSNIGWIKYPDQVIVCAPNELIIKIQDNNNNQKDIDNIAF